MVKSRSFVRNKDKANNICGKDEKSVRIIGWQSSANVRFEDIVVTETTRESRLKTLKIYTQLYYNI